MSIYFISKEHSADGSTVSRKTSIRRSFTRTISLAVDLKESQILTEDNVFAISKLKINMNEKKNEMNNKPILDAHIFLFFFYFLINIFNVK